MFSPNSLFEHYAFLPQLFDFSHRPTRDCSLWSCAASLGLNLGTALLGGYRYLAEELLGVSVFCVTMLFVILLVDLLTGLAASHHEGVPCTSKRGLRWVFKLGSYLLFGYVLHALIRESLHEGHGWLTLPLGVVRFYLLFHIALWEMKSIDENLCRLGYSLRIFRLAERLADLVEQLIARRIPLPPADNQPKTN